MELKNVNKTDGTILVNAIRLMFKNMKSGNTVYLAFSREGFHVLTFVMAMSIIANIVLVDLLVRAPTLVQKTDTSISMIQLILSLAAIAAGLWLFLKGVNIVTGK